MSSKKDLTRIEDLSEFIHEDDPELDQVFDQNDDDDEQDPPDLPGLDDLEDETANNLTPDFNEESVEEDSPEEIIEEEFSFEASDESFGADDSETATEDFAMTDQEEGEEEVNEDFITSEQEEWSLDSSGPQEILQEEIQEEQPPFESSSPSIPSKPESFEDVKSFARNMTYGKIASGGNPPYSLIIKNIKYSEDVEDILSLLGEFGLIDSSNQEAYTQSLQNGALLISQLSEYSAIFLAHKLRRYHLDVMMGLSEELHPSKSYDHQAIGLVSKENLKQNKAETVVLQSAPVELDQVMTATTPTLEGHRIHQYLGIVTEHSFIDGQELERLSIPQTEDTPFEGFDFPPSQQDEHNELMEKYAPGLQELYANLSQELKVQAYKLKANAVVGINFQITPLIEGSSGPTRTQYKITCSGTAVWVSGLGEML